MYHKDLAASTSLSNSPRYIYLHEIIAISITTKTPLPIVSLKQASYTCFSKHGKSLKIIEPI